MEAKRAYALAVNRKTGEAVPDLSIMACTASHMRMRRTIETGVLLAFAASRAHRLDFSSNSCVVPENRLTGDTTVVGGIPCTFELFALDLSQ
jgi:hypothetical protein